MFQVLDFVRCFFFFTFKLLKANVNFGRCTMDTPKFKGQFVTINVWALSLGFRVNF